jgi:hypothetical protein
VSGQLHSPANLPLGKEPLVPNLLLMYYTYIKYCKILSRVIKEAKRQNCYRIIAKYIIDIQRQPEM